MFAVKATNGFYFAGTNCQGLEIYNTSEPKRFATPADAATKADQIGGTVVSLPVWMW